MKDTGYIPGEWKVVCDSCGFDFLASELLLRWDGMRVCRKDWETRHPQEFVRPRPERISPDWVRPDTDTALIPVTWTDTASSPLPVRWSDGIHTVIWSDE